MTSSAQVRVGIIGMGGYAARHHEALLALEAVGEARLVCACDPAPAAFAAKAKEWKLAERGVAIHDDYRRMLDRHARELDILVVPTPIPLHAEMHRAGVERGLAVYLEKPPTLHPAELETMIAVDAAARVPTLVGFNFIAEPERQAVKRRLLAGEFGALREVRLLGLWPRPVTYYTRASWAGRLVGDDGRLVLDSCMGNALAHHVHNVLHWAGVGGQDLWASPARVRASMFRAHDIQGADTFFIATETDTDVPVRIVLSHACAEPQLHRETLVCEHADIDYITHDRVEIRWRSGETEIVRLAERDAQVDNYRALFACLRGEASRSPTTLPDCRPFVRLQALAYIAAGRIQGLAADQLERATNAKGATYVCVRGLEEAAARFFTEDAWPWGAPSGQATPADLDRLEAVVRRLAEAR